jgi:hypothetical protein
MFAAHDFAGHGTSAANRQRAVLRTIAALVMTFASSVAIVVAAAPTAGAAASPRLSWSVAIDGHDVRTLDSNSPLRLTPSRSPTIDVRVSNNGATPVRVRAVRLEGRILGLAFFSYSTAVDLQAAPGASDERRFSIDTLSLDGQATGLLPTRVSLLDSKGGVIVSRSLAVDVRGSLRSVYGAFGLAVAAITLLLLVGALWRLLTDRLHQNRWRRGMVFCAPGLGVGFTVIFTLSALRLMVPSWSASGLVLLVCGVIGFAAGYVTPTPYRPDQANEGLLETYPLAERLGEGRPVPATDVVDLRDEALSRDSGPAEMKRIEPT